MIPFRSPGVHHARQTAISQRTVALVRKVWAKIDGADLDVSWSTLVAELNSAVSAGQWLAAREADRYVDSLLIEQRAPIESVGVIDPAAFVQVDVEQLYSPVVATKRAVARGTTINEALVAGAARLVQVATTATADAGRQAVLSSMTTHPAVTKYSRMVRPPACSRCVLLSGTVYSMNDGFQRHPMCRCVHIPLAEDLENDLTPDPKEYFKALSTEDQDKYFTKAGAEAIRDGADIGQVVNARKGMYTAADGQLATNVGNTRRALAGRRMAANGPEALRLPGVRYSQNIRLDIIRPMPETIYKQANSRAEALQMLRDFGYVV